MRIPTNSSGEAGVADVSVELTKSTDTTFRLKIRTDADGKFRFGDLEPGDYALYVIYDAKYFSSPTSAMKDSTTEEGGTSLSSSSSLRFALLRFTHHRYHHLLLHHP
jgi:hypothetical protein